MSRDSSNNSTQETSRDDSWGAARLNSLVDGIGIERSPDSDTKIQSKDNVINARKITEQLEKQDSQDRVFQDIVREHNGAMYLVDLKTATLEEGCNGNSVISSLLKECLSRDAGFSSPDFFGGSSVPYFLSAPLFLGQMSFFGRDRVASKYVQTGKKIALLLNLMLTIHTGRVDKFVFFPDNGQAMIEKAMHQHTALICSFLLKSGDLFKFSSESGSTPSDFITNLYQKHFLFFDFLDGRVAIMHFSGLLPVGEDTPREAVKNAIFKFNKDNKLSGPSYPIVFEKKMAAQDQVNRPPQATAHLPVWVGVFQPQRQTSEPHTPDHQSHHWQVRGY